MKLNKTILSTTLATLLLIGCGGGSGGSNDSSNHDGTYEEPESYTLFMPKVESPNTYECTLDNSRTDMYTLKSYFSNEADCTTYANTWIENFTHEDSPTIDREQQQEGLDYINAIRANIGLVQFKHNKELEEANRLHALYLKDVHSTFGVNKTHYEDNVNYPSEYYRGDSGTDRARASGYSPISWAGEDLSFEEVNSISSIDELLTAIYHRQALLWNWVDEIGVGVGSGGGNDFHAEGQLFGLKDDNRIGFLQAISTDMVCFPYSMQGGISRAFKSNESPAPLPDIDYWTGNPISVTFNQMKVDDIELLSFKLYKTDRDDDGDGSDSADIEITNSRIMTVDMILLCFLLMC